MKKLLLSILIPTCISVSAQNLVVNGSFEEIDAKAKGRSGVSLANGWSSATERAAELFSLESKEEIYKAPDNKYGREKAFQGINYAGIVAFSYQGKEPRSYVTGELMQPLEKGKTYCVKFQTSLSDIAKYSSNNLGAYFTKKEFKADGNNQSILTEAHVVREENDRVIDVQVYWEPVCGKYTAEGGEEYITIGNFYGDKATLTGKAVKAKQFAQNQIPVAYYYIDDVSVTPYDEDEGCSCGQKTFVDTPRVIYQKQEESISHDVVLDEILTEHIMFDSLKAELKGEALNRADKLANIMKSKSTLKVAIVGHTNNSEDDKVKKNPALSKLSQQRAEAVAAYLLKNGISKDRFKVEAARATQPFTFDPSPTEQLKNCAVDIQILSE